MTTDNLGSESLVLNPGTLWSALESAAEHGSTGWRLIRCRQTPGCSLFAAVEPVTKRRVLLLPLNGARSPSRSSWPRCNGLDPISISVSGEAHVGVGLKERRFADVFDALLVDVSRKVEAAVSSEEALAAMLGQLARWHKFLTAATGGLSVERQRGLWGELHCLREHLMPAVGNAAAVSGWHGPAKAHQDFQFSEVAIEVKTTTAKQPQSVRITSERQLDDKKWKCLFLHVLVLEEMEGSGLTLPDLIAEIRIELLADPLAQESFEDALLMSGYLGSHEHNYTGIGRSLRVQHWFRVSAKFPRIVEDSLPSGVGDISYGLNLAACGGFIATPQEVVRALVT